MKRKNVSSQPVTKTDLESALKKYATKEDLLIVKQELKEEIVGDIDEKNEKYKDEVMTKLDDISGQLEDLQEDKVLSIHQTEELRGKVDSYEKRIKNLEKIPQTA